MEILRRKLQFLRLKSALGWIKGKERIKALHISLVEYQFPVYLGKRNLTSSPNPLSYICFKGTAIWRLFLSTPSKILTQEFDFKKMLQHLKKCYTTICWTNLVVTDLYKRKFHRILWVSKKMHIREYLQTRAWTPRCIRTINWTLLSARSSQSTFTLSFHTCLHQLDSAETTKRLWKTPESQSHWPTMTALLRTQCIILCGPWESIVLNRKCNEVSLSGDGGVDTRATHSPGSSSFQRDDWLNWSRGHRGTRPGNTDRQWWTPSVWWRKRFWSFVF